MRIYKPLLEIGPLPVTLFQLLISTNKTSNLTRPRLFGKINQIRCCLRWAGGYTLRPTVQPRHHYFGSYVSDPTKANSSTQIFR